ncbi:Methyl-accepting chemotaxis sensor/transducer protein [hydrothermal vent metagenome]|uniref:Methyl-accepting chemotaxis sensor/transducer protein n=1 Tax=hydrothermal vent metagenome TaxID=652676 RepID=A0A3B0U5W8_9ZZZZ
MIIIMFPLLAFLGIGIDKLTYERSKATIAGTIANVIEITPKISNLVHELQKERGTSAGYISSGGKKFADTIDRRRAGTDKALGEFETTLSAARKQLDFQGFKAPFSKAKSALDELSAMRRAVKGLSISVGQMAGYYTPLIAELLSMVESVSDIADDENVIRPLAAYTALLQGKERAGLERAMGAAGFGSGTFKPVIYRKFIHFGAKQDTFFSIFQRYASKEQIEAFQGALSGPVHDDVDAMRKLAYAAPFGGDITGVSGADWFAVSTRRIDAMKKIEDGVAGDIVAQARVIADTANWEFWRLAAMFLGLLAFSSYVTFVIARSISTPIKHLTLAMGKLAKGELKTEIPACDRKDEIGEMSDAVQVFKENAVRTNELEAEQIKQKMRTEEKINALMVTLADNFDASVGEIIQSVSTAASELINTAQSMSSIAEETSNQAGAVAAASEQASNNVQTVASATEEMSNSIAEISHQVTDASNASKKAVENVATTAGQMNALARTADKIGGVVSLISDIAEQTNLLALNATIEAARAGESGKGFAVVAGEVKTLASETAKATESISEHMKEIQAATGDAVSSIDEISTVIRQIEQTSAAIAVAMEQQGEATYEITRNVQEAAAGTQEVTSSITGVTQASQETGTASGQVTSAADELSQQSEMLKSVVEHFLVDLRLNAADRRTGNNPDYRGSERRSGRAEREKDQAA